MTFHYSQYYNRLNVLFCVFISLLCLIPSYGTALVFHKTELKIFQFPSNMIPRIDGIADDWDYIPDEYSYSSDMLREVYLKDLSSDNGSLPKPQNPKPDPNDLDARVTVGWVKGLNRLYFLYEVYDDFWDFRDNDLHSETFEISVDGDLSGGDFIFLDPKHYKYPICHKGSHAQNFHIFTPPVDKRWSFVWNGPAWLNELPWFNCAWSRDFEHGESGKLVFECWLTPFDYASFDGPWVSTVSQLHENGIIGLSWIIADFDGPGVDQQYYCLSHTILQAHDASLLRPFRLMPLEKKYLEPLDACFVVKTIDMDNHIFAFRDRSYGNILSWLWDFDDGTTSTEQNPVHTYKKTGQYNVVLTVTSQEGSSRYWYLWEVLHKNKIRTLPITNSAVRTKK